MNILIFLDLGTLAEKHILGVRQLLAVPLSEDSSQFGTIFELGHPSQMEVLAGCDGLTSQINNLEGNQHIIHLIHTIQNRHGLD